MSFRLPAQALINRLGKTITLTTPGAPTYDPVTGTVTNGAGVSASVRADIMNATDSKMNIEVQAGDLAATIVAGNFTPTLSTEVILEGKTYRAIAINDVFAFDELTLHEIQLRRIS